MLQTQTTQPPRPPVFVMCTHELWEGLRCTRRHGHVGSHQARSTSVGGCTLTWRAEAEKR